MKLNLKTYKDEGGCTKTDCPICEGAEHVDYIIEHGICQTCEMENRPAIKELLTKIPSYCYRMCYNDTGEVYKPDGSTYDIFHNKVELIHLLSQIISYEDNECGIVEYPYEEGQDYWTIEAKEDGNCHAIESCWDEQSEEMYDELIDYFDTLDELIKWCVDEYDSITVCPMNDRHKSEVLVFDVEKGKFYSEGKINLKENKYKRVFKISFDVAETARTTAGDRYDLCYSISNFIGNFVDIRGNSLEFHCVNGDYTIEDMSHAYGENELEQLNDFEIDESC